jgi:hypothetical protein
MLFNYTLLVAVPNLGGCCGWFETRMYLWAQSSMGEYDRSPIMGKLKGLILAVR